MKGYRLEGGPVRRDLYRLVCAFMALNELQKIHGNDESDPLNVLQAENAEGEIVRLLITTAVMNRLHMDHMRSVREDEADVKFPPKTGTCGELNPDITDIKLVPLTLREACNKIIHADEVSVSHPPQPVLRIEGKSYNKSWIATIDVIEYVRLSEKNIEDALA